MKKISLYIIFIIFSLNSSKLSAQIEEDRIKASMLYYICDYILWPDISENDTFNIGILGDEDVLMDELKLIAPSQKIHGMPLQVFQEQNIHDIHPKLNALFVGEEWHSELAFILDYCRKMHVLLFTDELENSIYSVIDFQKNEEDQSINFNVNKQNLILSNLDYKDELLLYGGDLIDVRELYNSIQKLLEEESEKVLLLNIEIQNKDSLISMKNISIEKLSKNIRSKIKTLDKLSDTIALQKEEMERQYEQMQNQLKIIHSTNQQIKALKREKYQQTIDISNREKDIRNKIQELEILDLEIQQNKTQIKEQSESLKSQAKQINMQSRLIILVTTLVLSLLAIGLLLLKNNRINKRNNLILEEQKEELETTLSKLQSTQNKLVESEKLASIGMLASGVAHEINNPLNYIQGGVYGLETMLHKFDDEDKEDINLVLNGIKTGVSRAAKIVASLNYFNRSSENYAQTCNIVDIVENCLTMLHNKWKHNIEINKHYASNKISCTGNEGKLHQGFLNILSNAVQAIEGKGTITINIANKSKNFIEISISDSGVGMGAEVLEKAVEPFYTTKKPGEGTGLGLSITQRIVADHKGNMEISSTKNNGTTVIVQLPRF